MLKNPYFTPLLMGLLFILIGAILRAVSLQGGAVWSPRRHALDEDFSIILFVLRVFKLSFRHTTNQAKGNYFLFHLSQKIFLVMIS